MAQTDSERNPDFTDQPLLSDPLTAQGPSSDTPGNEDPVAEGDEVYVPPTDPVVTTDEHGQAQVLGGFSISSMDSVEVARSSDGTLGDEAIADAIRRELREDAATTALQVEVLVRNGVAYLRGTVPTVDDAEEAEEVAARVPGAREVIEELDIPGL